MLNSRLKAFAERLLPGFLIAWLDPVQEIIESEVKRAAGKLRRDQVVLDAGAGEARHKKHFLHGRYLALDVGCGDSTWNYSKIDIRGDLEKIPLRNSSVDCILCMAVLEHTRHPHMVLFEFARVLKSGGTLLMVAPFLWEEHQIPHDYFRFTRYGIRSLFESSHLRIDLLNPMGGFFWLCARRSISLLTFFQRGWRWILFTLLVPFFGLLFPLILYFLDTLDKAKNFTLGFQIRATKVEEWSVRDEEGVNASR